MTGVFSLVPDGSGYRVVNDRRPVIPAKEITEDSTESMNTVIARASLPSRNGCAENVYEVGSDVRSITISLVGSRAAWNMLEQQIGTATNSAAACSCAVLAEVWKVDDGCLDHLHGEFLDLTKVNAIRDTNQALWRREHELFRRNPVVWFMRTVDGWGLDGAALRLDQLLRTHIVNPTDRTCRILAKSAESGEIHDRVFTSALNAEEIEAKAHFLEWLRSGCPSS